MLDAGRAAAANTFDNTDWRDWLPQMLRVWAAQYARIQQGGRMMTNADGSASWHFDGWPLATVLGKIKTEGEGAAQGRSGQHFAEVYSGDGRLIWLAMQGLRYPLRLVIHAKYLGRTPWRETAQVLGLTHTSYWSQHNEAHTYIAARVPLV